MLKRIISLVCISALLTGVSGGETSHGYYTGPERSAAEIAVLSHTAAIDHLIFTPKIPIENFVDPDFGHRLPPKSSLLPGTYEIQTDLDKSAVKQRRGEVEKASNSRSALAIAIWIFVFQGHDMIPTETTSDKMCAGNKITVTVLPGHSYQIDGDFFDDTCWLWIKDIQTDEVVADSNFKTVTAD